MKKNFFSSKPFFVLVSLLLSISLSSVAQEQKHHIELSVSEPFSTLWGLNLMMTTTPRSYEAYENAFSEWASVSRPYGNYSRYEDEWFCPPITLGYYYQLLPWMQVGGEVSTAMLCTTENYLSTGKSYAHWLNTNLYIAPGVRFNYYHKKITDLYSGVNLGVNVKLHSTEKDPLVLSSARVTWQLTALGVRFGKRVYGNVELGYGYKGLLSVGVGTRF